MYEDGERLMAAGHLVHELRKRNMSISGSVLQRNVMEFLTSAAGIVTVAILRSKVVWPVLENDMLAGRSKSIQTRQVKSNHSQ